MYFSAVENGNKKVAQCYVLWRSPWSRSVREVKKEVVIFILTVSYSIQLYQYQLYHFDIDTAVLN